MTKRLGLFTRLLADTPAALPAQVYRNATEQFVEAERLGFDVGWVAQHHFDAEEGGLPSPLVFLAGVAAHTARIRLATGIITAALEDPVRVAEDAAVLDAVSGGRVELGLGSGGSTDAFTAFPCRTVRRVGRQAARRARRRAARRHRPAAATRRVPAARRHLAGHILPAGRYTRRARRIRAAALPDPAPHRGRAARHARADPAADRCGARRRPPFIRAPEALVPYMLERVA